MADNSDSDMDLDMLEESEDELNITTYFHDDIEESSDDDDSRNPLADDYTEVLMEIILSPMKTKHDKESTDNEVNKAKSGDNFTKIPIEETIIVEDNYALLDDRYAEAPMDVILGPMEARKRHMILCPVCYEIAIISKQSKLYDNIIVACMEKNSK